MYFFFFNDTATTEIYTLSLHDALPISHLVAGFGRIVDLKPHEVLTETGDAAELLAAEPEILAHMNGDHTDALRLRSEEHTSELQSRPHLVCRLLLVKIKSMLLPVALNT